ncbi:MAG: KpsF/GutQ family sugar-phosphate isomerase [Opitutaceae bacterium]
MPLDPASAIRRGKDCITTEALALEATARSLDHHFAEIIGALNHVLDAGRKLIFSGLGKSAHIARKCVGTFNSIGAPSCFLDPVNALHGDLGLCQEGDICLLLSNSGESEELLRLVPLIKRFGLASVAITSHPESTLAGACDHVLAYVVPREACPLSLAPTASTVAAMAIGDALAMVLLEDRGLTRDDFARFHPAGNIGRNLILRVTDVMLTGDRFPRLPDDRTVQDAILSMTKAKAGCIALTSEVDGTLNGVFTDGDFRRCAVQGGDFLNRKVSDYMTRSPVTVRDDSLVVDALRVFEVRTIDDLIVVDGENRPVGLIDGQDLPRMRLI